MGRAWVAPFSFSGPGPLHDVEIGGSLWTGDRANTLAPTSQTTQAGFTFLNFGQFTTTYNGTANTAMQLRQVGPDERRGRRDQRAHRPQVWRARRVRLEA